MTWIGPRFSRGFLTDIAANDARNMIAGFSKVPEGATGRAGKPACVFNATDGSGIFKIL